VSFAAIYLPEFPAMAWLRAAPQLRAQPFAILAGVPPQERIVSLNQRAKASGIRRGMGKAQAEAACAVQFRSRRIEEEKNAFALVTEIAQRFSPRVQAVRSSANDAEVSKPLSASLLIDSSGIGTLFGTIEQYARKLHQDLTDAGFPAGVGVAPNAAAALLLAQTAAHSREKVICADQRGLQAKLAPLPVSLLPCEPKMLGVFSRWGIRTLGELAALPQSELISRLGQQGQHLQQLALGAAKHLLVPEELEFTLSETMTLDNPLDLLDSLLFVLAPMLEAILRKARERAYALRSATLTLQLERGAPHTIQIRPALPSQDRESLLKLLHLELTAHPPPSGILAVTLNADPAKPQTAQRGLFQAQFPDPGKLDLLLARLRSIAGEGNVGSPELQNSYSEDDFAMAPFRPVSQASTATEQSIYRLAVRVFRPPQPARVVSEGKQLRSLYWQGARLQVAASAGPWNTSGAWWDERSWDSEHWDVVIAEPAQALRLRYERASKAWFVIGLYD
jgi:protein ImuB